MIAYPPLSIPGALVLVPATLLISVGSVWLLRRDWSEPWPPDVRPDLAKQLRLRRIFLIANSVLLPVALAYGVYSAFVGAWWMLAYALFLSFNAVYSLVVYRKLADTTTTIPSAPATEEQLPNRGEQDSS
ncbi:small-conductance mechanosensitive channel [Cryobacterium sp. CAN_C3]|nr:small-conductance mechanosensitive channel [Cryobacterium sp. CAN_C3]